LKDVKRTFLEKRTDQRVLVVSVVWWWMSMMMMMMMNKIKCVPTEPDPNNTSTSTSTSASTSNTNKENQQCVGCQTLGLTCTYQHVKRRPGRPNS
jgi:hypothetical protein